ncbi:hypothetical protein KIW84_045227 [Lathyrus oleraceus]|uniref:Uncharacterized protein n=1 Tax=Pisum sativum TaxID=3888 RepID=A0A9D5ATY7_PEA|nr:hypothetical protein KIW84_045227 [Pisum sativum]
MCSLLTSASLYILTESLKSLLKELYLDHCLGIDAALIVPALVELEHLEVLSVAGIPTVSDTFVKDYIVARGHNMKELILKDCIDEAIAAFVETNGESLKELSLNNVKKVGCHTTLSLASHAKKLHSLDVSWYCIRAHLENSLLVRCGLVAATIIFVIVTLKLSDLDNWYKNDLCFTTCQSA